MPAPDGSSVERREGSGAVPAASSAGIARSLGLRAHRGASQGAQEHQDLRHALGTSRGPKACPQALRQALGCHRRQEAGARRSPKWGGRKDVAPPRPPPRKRPRGDREPIGDGAGGNPSLRRDQHQRQGHIHPAPQEPHRGRGRACLTPPTGKAQSVGILGAHRHRATARLAGVIRDMQGSGAVGATASPGFGGQFGIDTREKTKKRRVLQQVMAHWWGLLGLETGDSPEEALVIKISEGDFPYVPHET